MKSSKRRSASQRLQIYWTSLGARGRLGLVALAVVVVVTGVRAFATEEVEPNSAIITTKRPAICPSFAAGCVVDCVHASAVEGPSATGWNSSRAVVLPLGQKGYVKRDLPVYRAGFEDLGFVLADDRERNDLEVVSDSSIVNKYSVVLCLSFNTDHCLTNQAFKALSEDSKINRIYGLREVAWSKHALCRSIKYRSKSENDVAATTTFTFECFVMPEDFDRLMSFYASNSVRMISKPRSLGAGMGIRIEETREDLLKLKSTKRLVQRFLEKPHLIEKDDGMKYKWDARLYVLVTSVVPMRAYVHRRGLVRIATTPYDSSNCSHDEGDTNPCLTNTSLNHNDKHKLKDITWSLKKLSTYLESHDDEDFIDLLENRTSKAIAKTLLALENSFLKLYSKEKFSCVQCYHLLGVDVIFDYDLEPFVVEINGEPNLKTTSIGKSHYDVTKKRMAKDVVKLVFEQTPAAPRTTTACGKVDKKHHKYVSDTLRENFAKTGFHRVYPSLKHESELREFVRNRADARYVEERLKIHDWVHAELLI